MSTMKTVLIVGVAVGATAVAANYMTDGAVFEAASNVIRGAFHKSEDVAEAVTDAAEKVAEVVDPTASI